MLKLIKYEFRKNRTSLLIMLCICAALLALAPLGKALNKTSLMVISVTTLSFYAFAAFIYVLLCGIRAYSGELKSKTGYLLLMTPHSTVSIVFSKLLFTLFFAVVLGAAAGLATVLSANILLRAVPDAKMMIDFSDMLLTSGGVNTFALLSTVLMTGINILSFIVVAVAAAYLAITLSATVMQQKKGRGLISFLLFAALAVFTIWLSDKLFGVNSADMTNYSEMLLATLPETLFCFATACVYALLSGLMLRKWVTL